MRHSENIKKAIALIQSVKGKQLDLTERKKIAMELAALMMTESQHLLTSQEKKMQRQMADMMNDPQGKVFTARICDQCFRSSNNRRITDQLIFTLKQYGIPNFVPQPKQLQMKLFQSIGQYLPNVFASLAKKMLRKETSSVIIPGEDQQLASFIKRRTAEGVRVNLNHLGEAILGENEAEHRLNIYLEDLARPEVEYISVKASTIFSQINLLAWDQTLKILSERLRALYHAAMEHKFKRPDGTLVNKFVNLDMEEYRDLAITVALFQKVLDEPGFFHHSAGIVLQSYLPDSYEVQKSLTEWALKRAASGGAPIKIRIVKGANLAMEQVESSLEGWAQAPYTTKEDVDANYKRMVNYGMEPAHAKAVHLGIASHNIFDIAYALILRSERGVENEVCFEMLEGMADHQRRLVQQLTGDMLLYCPSATEEEFVNAVAYLVRRLDENTAPENFLRHSFDLLPGTPQWDKQAQMFERAYDKASTVSSTSRRKQQKAHLSEKLNPSSPFANEPNTDWTLLENRQWLWQSLKQTKNGETTKIPLVIAGRQIWDDKHTANGYDPSHPREVLYRYCKADENQALQAIDTAVQASRRWKTKPLRERLEIAAKVAQGLRQHRADLIHAMVADGGKIVTEADIEITEAIDFAEYYLRNMQELTYLKDIEWHPKGVVLVCPPWNFPCAIGLGGIVAGLITGNSVIFKPAPQTVLVGWHVANICWEAGVSKEALQFINCDDDPIGSLLVKDPRIDIILLTGATSTAKLFLKLHPGLDLVAETGGKNTLIVTALSDRDLAIKTIIQSAFGHSGQKCSACSLAILEAEVYDDPHFRKQLRDAAASLSVGPAWDLKTKINPLIHEPESALLKGLTQLEEGEEWLLQPKRDADNPNLWSPGIKLGVKKGSFTQQTELFGPVLGLMRAESLTYAVRLANTTPYGLTAGLHSLDVREQSYWIDRIEAGNLYINRGITGAIVQRQPFGGCKASSFGRGAKAGGPNYLTQLMRAEQISLPEESAPLNKYVEALLEQVDSTKLTKEEKDLLEASVHNYAFYWNHYFSQQHDPSKLIGQDNFLRYLPRRHVVFRVQTENSPIDILRILAAGATCGCRIELSIDKENLARIAHIAKLHTITGFLLLEESEEQLIQRIKIGEVDRLRYLSEPSKELLEALSSKAVNLQNEPVLANGRLELLNYLREVSLSIDYHRYGNLGARENEERSPLASTNAQPCKERCSDCSCFS